MILFNEKQPIYIQIMDYIKKNIASGRMKSGEKILSIRDMSEKLKVNSNTIQRVYQELEREGVTETKRGMGVFITSSHTKIKQLQQGLSEEYLRGFTESMLEIGYEKKLLVSVLETYLEKEGGNGNE